MIAGGTTVLLISASDCERGVLTESDELFTALSRAVIVALITGGLGNAVGTASAVVNKSVEGFVRYLIVGALTLGVSGVSTAITDTIYDQEWSWERALKSGIFDLAMAWLAMGLKDAGKAANAVEGRDAAKTANAAGGTNSPKGLIGHDFEDWLTENIGGDGSFSKGGRDFDGGSGNRWWEAKSGQYWDMLEDEPKKLLKFKSDMGHRLNIAKQNGATYELFSNTPIPQSIKDWLTKKGIPFTEILD